MLLLTSALLAGVPTWAQQKKAKAQPKAAQQAKKQGTASGQAAKPMPNPASAPAQPAQTPGPIRLMEAAVEAVESPKPAQKRTLAEGKGSSPFDPKAITLTDEDNRFYEFVKEFLQGYFSYFPEAALGAGLHTYDSLLPLPTAELRDRQTFFLKEQLGRLGEFIPSKLSERVAMDHDILRNELEAGVWYLNEYRSFEWNPSQYNPMGTFSEIMANPKVPRKQKYRDLAIRIRAVPAYYEAALLNIRKPTAEHTKLAIQQLNGSIEVFNTELPDSLKKARLPRTVLIRALEDCKAATEATVAFVNALQNRDDVGSRSFRLGPEQYARKFAYEIRTGVGPAEAYKAALARKEELLAKMSLLASKLAGKYGLGGAAEKAGPGKIKEVIDVISQKHCKPADFQETIRKQIPALAEFVRRKDLIRLDPSKPLIVRAEPAYMAGVAGASISAPGPYEKGGNTYYNVGSLASMDAKAQESYLREYNDYTLQILNIHEAIPGHYAQLVYANESPSIVKSIFGNGAMVEGWAVYSELMMLENGYGNDSPEMWLMYYKWNLRTVCNTILDYSVHNLGMTEEQAMKLLTEEAFQTEAEARGKWRRATLSNVQLCSYFCGFDAILKLREKLKAEEGDAFNQRNFHERFLSYGSAPVELIATDMLGSAK